MFHAIKSFFTSQAFTSFVLCLIVGLLIANFYDRRRAVEEINTKLSEYQLSRVMLNSRAQIQIILLNAALEGRKLSPTEIDTVKKLWKSAEYDRAMENEPK